MSSDQDSQIFKATYSGVPVYEMLCKAVAVMRRRSDSYVNATQILKVAGFDKPQRTRILEREVQIGEHEKVQGGYGKYQGTWVPLERGQALAKLYEVDDVLAPILEFVKGSESPPLAPKHVTAASSRPRKPRETRIRKKPKHYDEDISDIESSSQKSPKVDSLDTLAHHSKRSVSTRPDVDELPTKRTRHASQKSTNPNYNHHHNQQQQQQQQQQPQQQTHNNNNNNNSNTSSSNHHHHNQNSNNRSRHKQQQQYHNNDIDHSTISTRSSKDDLEDELAEEEYEMNEKTYAQKLLDYFMSSETGVTNLLAHPPRDLDINIIIDDDGHTSLHWAAALARVNLVKVLIDNNADINRVNFKGQTALMRSVLFTNNFEAKSFENLLSLLQKTIFHIDKKDQTVFHHIATTASLRGKVHASRYYMECLIDKLNSSNRSELISILNVQDVSGDTALTIAARIGNKKLVKVLIDAGASTEIANEEGMSAKDYLNELLEKSTSSTSPPPLLLPGESGSGGGGIINETDTREILRQKVETMYKQASSATAPGHSSVPPISEVFDSFAESYERDLTGKEKLIQKKKMELNLFKKRLADTTRALAQSEHDPKDMEVAEKTGEELENQLKKWLHFSQKQMLNCYYEQELENTSKEDKEAATAVGGGGEPEKKEESEEKQKEELKKTIITLKGKLQVLQKSRQDCVHTILTLLSQIPPKLYQDYKRLISTCCNVSYENVDSMLSPLLASFDEAEN